MSLTLTRTRSLALLAGAAAVCVPTSRAQAQTTTLRIANVPVETAADAYYAQDMGFFAKAGFDVALEPIQNGAAIVAAVVSGAIDIGWAAVDVLAAVHGKNVPVTIIAPSGDYLFPTTERVSAILLPASSPAQRARDLNGKIVAVTGLNNVQVTITRAWIDKNGGDSSTLKFIEIPLPAMPAALGAGRVDAARVSEPFIGVALKNGSRVLAYGGDAISKHYLIGAWFTTLQWAKNQPDVVSRFAAVIHGAAVWANANPAQSAEILAKYVKIDPTVIATMARGHFAEQLTPALAQPLIDAAAKYNGFNAFPASDLIYRL